MATRDNRCMKSNGAATDARGIRMVTDTHLVIVGNPIKSIGYLHYPLDEYI